MNPSISAICVTYGRTKLLAESIACFQRQRYDGPKELIILNTFPQQQILAPFENVRVINLAERPASLGDARNMAIEAATGEVIVTWDDDDLFTANHLDNIGFPMSNPAVQWVWLDKQFYAEGHQILKVVDGQLPCLAFRKSAWEKAGKYVALTVGEVTADSPLAVSLSFLDKLLNSPITKYPSFIAGETAPTTSPAWGWIAPAYSQPMTERLMISKRESVKAWSLSGEDCY